MDNKDFVMDVLAETGVKTVWSQNDKMKRSSKDGIHLYNWGIPAFKSKNGTLTCPMAKQCVAGCYAKSGAYIWSNVAQAYENRLSLSQDKNFQAAIMFHIEKLLKKHKTGLILLRIHDSGDFYSPEYQKAWYSIAKRYATNNRIKFYAYTKMVQQTKDLEAYRPSNFETIFSLGGHQDALINQAMDRHSRVFANAQDLTDAGYINASQNDTDALGDNPKIGLVYHGVKSYTNTTWSKVK